MAEFEMDISISYQDLEPLVELEVALDLPEGVIMPEWFDLSDLESVWNGEIELDISWFGELEIEPAWMQIIESHEPDLTRQPVQDIELEP
jgi:hypothetical protein